ncbi:MAG TPA: polyphosphate kinase 1 [Rhodothermia bacterium]
MSDLLNEQDITALSQLAENAADESVRQRARILLLYQEGRGTQEISSELDMSPSRVRHWRRAFLAEGIAMFRSMLDGLRVGGDGHPAFAEPSQAKGPSELSLTDPRLYLNRELSLLEFQRRVLEEAKDPTNPLLERIKFIGIVASNLDEFFMIRVGGLTMQIDAGVADTSPDAMQPTEQVAAIRKVALELMRESRRILLQDLLPELDVNGIHIRDYEQLTEKQKAAAKRYFDQNIFPVLTPMGFDPGHPFPHISNLSLNLAVRVRKPDGQTHFARLKVPGSIPRLIPVKKSSGGVRKDGTVPYDHYFVWTEHVIAAHLEALFPGIEIVESHPFRVTRNADMSIQELEASDLLESVEQSIRKRRFGSVVRVSVNPSMPEDLRQILAENLDVDRRDLYVLDGPLGLGSLFNLGRKVDRLDLLYPPFLPTTPSALRPDVRDADIFTAIRKRDHLLHQPYESFDPVINFLEEAAKDPGVLAIKQTLYRVGRNSPVVQALLRARENGKQVTVLVELKARFDEESNIGWAKVLEDAGVHVIYGLLGLKTHSKIALVVRSEGAHIRRYIHLATGNYNAVTAHLYEDLGFFTSDPDIGADATDLFNYLTGYSAQTAYRKLFVAPVSLRQRMEELITREIEHQRAGRGGHLVFKMNSLVDSEIIKLLYEASQAGVRVELIVRGVCCLRPGVPGVSDNITVRSIVGRFLEHSRIYYFRNAGNELIYLGSADMMPRNLNRRVEILFPIEDRAIVRRLKDSILTTYLRDNQKARIMQPDGSFLRATPGADEEPLNCQEHFLMQNPYLKD